MWLHGWVGYVIAGLIGCVVGWVELGQRYSDSPFRVLTWRATWLYLATNVGGALLALALVRTLHWDFGQAGDAREAVQVFGAGLGAMALFRTRLFTAAQDSNHDSVKLVWSPATLLEGVLNIADNQARREQARNRLQAIDQMATLTWQDATNRLVPIVLQAIGASDSEQKRVAEFVRALVENPDGHPDEVRTHLLGMNIVSLAGPQVLQAAIQRIKLPSS